jgi:hypothetical protein
MKTLPLLLSLLLLPPVHEAKAPYHPHFQKKLEVSLADKGLTLKLSHLTATFNREGFETMAEGKGWHLANAHLELDKAVVLGGVPLEPGTYAIKARKLKSGAWELVADEKGRFSARFSEKSKSLKCTFTKGNPTYEHLSLDIQPSGNKASTQLYLDVRFDEFMLRSAIDVP